MKYSHIESRDNSLVKHITKLGQNASYRNQSGECVLHGIHLIIEANKAGLLRSLVIDIDSIAKYADFMTENTSIKFYSATSKVMQKITYLDNPTDAVGIANFCLNQFDEVVYNPDCLKENYFNQDCLILENIQDPGNLGTIMRAAKASGLSNIILSPKTVDPYNPKVLRASQGIQFGLNLIKVRNLAGFIQNYNYQVIATTPRASLSIYSSDLTKPIAWVFGNEGLGVSLELMACIYEHRSIPMAKDTESLNVAMAATICLFETYRQRLNQ